MKRTLLLLALALSAPAAAETVYLATPGIAPCYMTGATGNGVSPFVVTVSSLACAVANGDAVLSTEIKNSDHSMSSGNIHLENSGDASKGLCRKVANLNTGAKTFELQNCDGTAITGNGTYLKGGRISKATAYTVASHPRLYMNSALVSALPGTGSTGYSNSSRDELIKLNAAIGAWGSSWGSDRSGSKAAGFSVCWLALANTSCRDKALQLLDNIDVVLPTAACWEGVGSTNCGAPNQDYADYATQYQENWMTAFSNMYSLVSGPTKAKIIAFLLNDLKWSEGGINYTSTSLTKPAWKIWRSSTTISHGSGNVLIGSAGTDFIAAGCTPGDIIMEADNVNVGTLGVQIASCDSATQVTTTQLLGLSGASSSFNLGPAWDSSQYGLLWHQKHYDVAPACGNVTALPDVVQEFCDYGYPQALASDNHTGYNAIGSNNRWWARLQGYAFIGAALCGDDPRACLLWEQVSDLLNNIGVPRGMNIWSGFSQATSGYMTGRQINVPVSIDLITRNSVTTSYGNPVIVNFAKDLMKWGYSAAVPGMPEGGGRGRGGFTPTITRSYELNPPLYRGPLTAMMHSGSEPEAAYLRSHINRIKAGTTGSNNWPLTYNGYEYVWWWFLQNNPTITPVTTPTTNHFPLTQRAGCITLYGSGACPVGEGFYYSVSTTGNTDADTYLGVNMEANTALDQQDQLSTAGWLFLEKNGRVLMSGDESGLMGGRHRLPLVEIGGSSSTRKTNPNIGEASIYWYGGDSDYMVVNSNNAAAWTTATNVITDAEHVIHIKPSGGQDFIIHNVKVALGAANQIRGFQKFFLQCGTPSSTSCISMSSSGRTVVSTGTSPNVRLLAKVLDSGGGTNVLLKTESGSDTDGSVTSGGAVSFGTYVCPTTNGTACDTSETGAEWTTVYTPTTDTAATQAPISQTTSGGFRIVEIKHAASPGVAVFSTENTKQGSASFTTSHAGTALYVFSGVSAGTYDIARDGSTVCASVVVVDGANTMKCFMGSGSITFAAAGAPAPVSITTASPLSTCDVNTPCSRNFAATGGTSPYTWTLVSGSLPTGMSLSSGGVLSGTPTIGGTYNFRVRATDTLSATGEKDFSIVINVPTGIGDVRTMRFRFAPPRGRTVTSIHFDYGATSGLGSSSVVSCAAGCTVQLDAQTSANLYYRFQWFNGASAAGVASRIRSVFVP